MNTQQTTPIHEFGSIARFLIKLAGADEDLLARCPKRDVDHVKTVAIIMIIVWCAQSGLFSVVGHEMLAKPGEIRADLVLAGLIVATLVLLLDSFVFIRPSWTSLGIEQLKAGGFEVPGSAWAKAKAGIFFAVRLGLSFVFSLITAALLGVLIFSKDIVGVINRAYLERNAALFTAAGARVDEDMRKNAEARAQIANTIAQAEEEQAHLRETAVNPGLENPELKPLLDRVARLEQVRVRADQESVRARNFTINEGVGLPGEPGNSNQAGQGPKWRAGVERIAIAERHLNEATKALAAAQERLRQVQEATEAATKARLRSVEDRIAEVDRAKQAEKTQLAGLEEAYRQLTENRERIIWESVRRDPAFVPKDEGLLARVRVLQKLSDDQTIFMVIILFELAFFGIELAAVLCKVTTFVPAMYSVMLAKEDHLRAVIAAHEMVQEIAAAKARPMRAPETPRPSAALAQNGGPGNGAETSDSNGQTTAARPRGRPRGPGWRPKVWNPDGNGAPPA